MNVGMEFQIKRGVITTEDMESDKTGVLKKCVDLCKDGKFEEANSLILPLLSFSWDWSNGDGDPDEFFHNPESFTFACTEDNCDFWVGECDGCVMLTATVSFSLEGRDGIDLEELKEWIYDNAIWCGNISGDWGYDISDGENVWVVSIDGENVFETLYLK